MLHKNVAGKGRRSVPVSRTSDTYYLVPQLW